MPALLRPKAPFAADAIVVGDPGRAMLLAQELLAQPKMCNHARGLWGYSGATATGRELTIQSTGVGAPSAAAVLADLAGLGVRRAIRVGHCTALSERLALGDLLLVAEAVASEGSATALGVAPGEAVAADPGLLARLGSALGDGARRARIVSVDTVPSAEAQRKGALAADMQTLAVLARGETLGMRTAALLAVVEGGDAGDGGETLSEDRIDAVARRAGRAAAAALSA